MSKSSTYKEFFPYPSYRLEQEDIIQKIEKSARLKQNILLVAPNGTGKTIMALSALLPIALEQGLKIVYMCRTHTQSKRVIKELKKIHSSKGNKGVSGLSIRGRNEMCLNSTLLRLKARPTEAMAICKSLRSTNNCTYYRNLKVSTSGFKSIDLYQFDSPVDAEELIEFCKQKCYCPYFLSKRLLKEIPVIVCNFQWLFNPDIRFRFLKLLDTTLTNCILIVDECHNIIDVATEVNSHKLIPYTLNLCLTDLYAYKLPEEYVRFVNSLKNHLAQKIRSLPVGDTKIDAKDFLEKICKKMNFHNTSEIRSFLMNLLIDYDNRKTREKSKKEQVAKNSIKSLVQFWMEWAEKCNSDKFFFCYNKKKAGSRTYISLEIVALDPRDITLPLFKKSYACLNLTGTVNPYVYKHLTGLHWKDTGYTEIIAQSPFQSRNILALITNGISTAKNNRTPSMYQMIINKIQEVVENTPANIGIFCASYTIVNGLRMNGIIPAIQDSGKQLFIEDTNKSASENT